MPGAPYSLAAVLAGGTAVLLFHPDYLTSSLLAATAPPYGCSWHWGSGLHAPQPVAVRNRQSSLSIQLTEIPALVGIVFLSPWLLLSAISFGQIPANAQASTAAHKGTH